MKLARLPVLAAALLTGVCLAAAGQKPADPSSTRPMTSKTRLMVIRTLEAERVYVRSPFPMGLRGLTLNESGQVTPAPAELRGLVTQYGAASRPGDRVLITGVELKTDRILIEINGGPRKKKKWWQHLQVEGMGGSTSLDQGTDSNVNPRGSVVALVFGGYIPELTVERLKELLSPVFDFSAHSAAEAYASSLSPKLREAVEKHQVLVGMNREMAQMAKGRPPRKIREREGAQDYEEWIYGTPPEDVEFIRFVGDEVVRVEIMKVTGEKVVRTEREVALEEVAPHRPPAQTAEGAAQRPAARPTLTRPGEDPISSPGIPVSNRPDTRVPGAPDPEPLPPAQQPPPPPQAWTANTPAGS
jgi:hypothetical protein